MGIEQRIQPTGDMEEMEKQLAQLKKDLLQQQEVTRHAMYVEAPDRGKMIREELEATAHEDALTGLPNRRALEKYLIQEVGRVQPPGLPETRREGVLYHLTAVFVDADHFKQVNDTLGHAAGDEALKAIANFLEHNLDVRVSDAVGRMAGRYGGEEFLMVFPGASEQEIQQKLLSKSEDGVFNIPFEYKGEKHFVTLSCGIAGFVPGEDKDGKLMIARADQALYVAKQRGRKQMVVYDESMADVKPPSKSGERPMDEPKES